MSLFLMIIIGVGVFVLSTVILHVSAKIASVKGATFGKAMTTTLISMIILILLDHLMRHALSISGNIEKVFNIVVMYFILKAIYKTTWGKSIIVLGLQLIFMILIGMIFATLVGLPIPIYFITIFSM